MMLALFDIELMLFMCLVIYFALGPVTVYGLLFLIGGTMALQHLVATGWNG